MNLLSDAVLYLSAASLGLFVGALLTEAFVLVPMWRSLSPSEFFALHAGHAHRLFAFFAPLTIVATSLAAVGAATSLVAAHPGRGAAAAAAGLALAMLATYFFYFQRANAAFAAASIKPDELAAELTRWASWHWLRVVLGVGAFACALWALRACA